MKNFVIWILIFTLFLTQNVYTIEPLSGVAAVMGIISSLISAYRNLDPMSRDDRLTNGPTDILLTSVTEQLRHLEGSLGDAIKDSVVQQHFARMVMLTRKIDGYYSDMKGFDEFTKHSNATPTILSESDLNLSHNNDRPVGLMREIYILLTSTEPNNIFDSFIRKTNKGYTSTCLTEKTEDPLPKYLLDFLPVIVATELKVFLTSKMAAGILKNRDTDLKGINENLERDHLSIMHRFKELLSIVSRDVWRCDPEQHVEDVTYTKLYYVFRKFVVNEELLVDHNRCNNDRLADYPQKAKYCSPDEYSTFLSILNSYEETSCTHQPVCEGGLWGCTPGFDLNILDRIEIHTSKDISRRYDAIDIRTAIVTSKTHYGYPRPIEAVREITTLWSRLSYEYFNKCDIMLCTCEEYPSLETSNLQPTERYFYVKPVFADTKNNYVITGARIAKKDGIVFIQVQQGKLQQQCSIDASTVSWQTIQPYDLHNQAFRIEMRWTGIRSIELKETDVPHGHVLVGLAIGDSGSNSLRLDVYSLPVNNTNGCTMVSETTPLQTSSSPSEYGIDVKDKHLPDPKERSASTLANHYLKFSTSNMSQDVGQTTIPLLDIQTVTTRTPLPMGGAGFYFKYTGDYKGYLGLKLKTYDFSQDLKVDTNYASNSTLN